MLEQPVNAGGVLEPSQILGRDDLVKRLWQLLEVQSLYITAERRMGKSSVVRDKMGREPRPNYHFHYLDVAGIATPSQFTQKLYESVKDRLGWVTRGKLIASGVRDIGPREVGAAGAKVALSEKRPATWKWRLDLMFQDLDATAGRSASRVLLAFDELTLMLDKIRRGPGEDVAGDTLVMDLLDFLRSARQERRALRMIYTGSLGLHHVLTALREQGYQNSPVNDMAAVSVDPLSHADATELARRLLRGAGVPCADREVSASHLATVTDAMPFYIQSLVSRAIAEGKDGDPATMDRLLEDALRDPLNLWDLRYFSHRIATHYPKGLADVAPLILDALARSPRPLTLDEVRDALDPKKNTKRDKETVRRTLELLGLDHYTERDENDAYRFRHRFMARVWTEIRK